MNYKQKIGNVTKRRLKNHHAKKVIPKSLYIYIHQLLIIDYDISVLVEGFSQENFSIENLEAI